jgi:saccharopine dehydrogenase-like NADP-dependent oxidoreductase
LRTIVLGGAGNFGARIVRALTGDSKVELIVAGRRIRPAASGTALRQEVLDIAAPDFGRRVKALEPQLIIHCVGPFQSQDYRIARACLEAGAHYVDIADGRQFVADFPAALSSCAAQAQRTAICGASTLPALSCAVVESLRAGLQELHSIEIAIAPGQLAPRGQATLAAVFSYLGRPFPIWRRGRWQRAWGWVDLRRIPLDFGSRRCAERVCHFAQIAGPLD